MTAIAMHPAPRWRDLAVEQVRSVGLLLRVVGILLGVSLLIYAGVAIRVSINAHNALLARHFNGGPSFSYTPEVSSLITYLALLLPALMWHDESPRRRMYHVAMPVGRSTHAMTKAFAGWVWLMAGTAAFLLTVVAVDAITKGILGTVGGRTPVILAWEWLVPFTSVTIAYAFASAAAIGAETPVVWIVGPPLLYAAVSIAVGTLGLQAQAESMLKLFTGYYGLSASMGGWIGGMDAAGHATGFPSVERWVSASLLWGAAAAVTLVVISRRRAALK